LKYKQVKLWRGIICEKRNSGAGYINGEDLRLVSYFLPSLKKQVQGGDIDTYYQTIFRKLIDNKIARRLPGYILVQTSPGLTRLVFINYRSTLPMPYEYFLVDIQITAEEVQVTFETVERLRWTLKFKADEIIYL